MRLAGSPTAPPARVLRCHHDRDGRHRRLGNFHQSVRGRAAGAHAAADFGRVADRRRAGDGRRFHLGGTGHAPAGFRRPVCVPAGSLPSGRRLHLWMGAAAGDTDRRDGGGGGHLRKILSRDYGPRERRWANRRRGPAGSDCHQLPGCARRQQCAERHDVAQVRRHRGAGRGGNRDGRRRGASFAAAGSAGFLRIAAGHRRGHDPGGFRLWRVADLHVRGGRDARSAARSVARPGDGRDWGDRALPVGELRVPARARTGGSGGFAHPGIVGDAGGAGRARRGMAGGGHRGFHAGVPEPGHSDGAARVLRDGAGRAVLRARGLAFAAHGSAGGGDRVAGRVRDGHRPFGAL